MFKVDTVSEASQDVIFSLYKDQPIYRDLLQDFVSALDERLSLSRQAYDARSWTDLSKVMHQLRGAAATYGFPGLAAIAATIEMDSKSTEVREDIIANSMQEIDMTCRKIEAGMAQLLAD